MNLVGDLLEESQSEASRLRQRVEELVRDNEALKSTSFAASLCAGGPVQTETQSRPDNANPGFNSVDICYFHPYDTFQINLTFVRFILGKPCLHPTAEQEEEQTSCVGKTLQPEKPSVSHQYRSMAFASCHCRIMDTDCTSVFPGGLTRARGCEY